VRQACDNELKIKIIISYFSGILGDPIITLINVTENPLETQNCKFGQENEVRQHHLWCYDVYWKLRFYN
jgi:hypothetical protein